MAIFSHSVTDARASTSTQSTPSQFCHTAAVKRGAQLAATSHSVGDLLLPILQPHPAKSQRRSAQTAGAQCRRWPCLPAPSAQRFPRTSSAPAGRRGFACCLHSAAAGMAGGRGRGLCLRWQTRGCDRQTRRENKKPPILFFSRPPLFSTPPWPPASTPPWTPPLLSGARNCRFTDAQFAKRTDEE